MKIVQVQTQAEAAGAQRVSDMVGDGLRALGHEVRTVFMYRKTDSYDADPHADFILDHRPGGALDLVRACAGLIGYMRRERPDAIISYQHYGNIFGTLAGRMAGTQILIANQSSAPGKRGAMWLTARIDSLMGRFGAYDVSVVNSAWTEAQFDDFSAAYRKRIRRIDHGVISPSTVLDRAAARAAYGLPDSGFVIVSTGRLTELKNQRALVEAVARLPGVHLALAGVGPEEAALRALIDQHRIGDRVHLVGEIPPARIFDFLAAGDLFAFASRMESFGLSVVEAAVAGLPIVANDLLVLREVLTTDHRSAALFADAEQPDRFAQAIDRIRHEAGLAKSLADAGRRLAAKYSPDEMCRAYDALLVSGRALPHRDDAIDRLEAS